MITRQTLIRGGKKSLKVIIDISKYIIPSIFVIKILEHSGWLNRIADIFAPYMGYIGLPGEGALMFLLGQVSMYGAIAAITSLHWSVKQITIAGALITICHGIVIESAIVSKGGGNGFLIAVMRLIAAVTAGLVLNIVIPGV